MENKFMRVEDVAAELGVSASYAYNEGSKCYYPKRLTDSVWVS